MGLVLAQLPQGTTQIVRGLWHLADWGFEFFQNWEEHKKLGPQPRSSLEGGNKKAFIKLHIAPTHRYLDRYKELLHLLVQEPLFHLFSAAEMFLQIANLALISFPQGPGSHCKRKKCFPYLPVCSTPHWDCSNSIFSGNGVFKKSHLQSNNTPDHLKPRCPHPPLMSIWEVHGQHSKSKGFIILWGKMGITKTNLLFGVTSLENLEGRSFL